MAKKRWVYTRGGIPLPEPIEITDDYVEVDPKARPPMFTDRYLEGTVATDGTDIGSRRKRDEYLKRNGLAHADDFRKTWEKATRKRAEEFQGNYDHSEAAEQVARTAYELRTQRKKR